MNRTMVLALAALAVAIGIIILVFCTDLEKAPNKPLPPAKSEELNAPLPPTVKVEQTSVDKDRLADATKVPDKAGKDGREQGEEKGLDRQASTGVVSPAPQEKPDLVPLDEAATKEMIAQLADPKLPMPNKIRALGEIARFKDVRLLPVVRTFTKDSNDDLRRNAFVALGQIGAAEDLSLIQAGLSDPNLNVQGAAKSAEEQLRARLPQARK